MRPYNNFWARLQRVPQNQCKQLLSISTGSEIHISADPGSITRVKLFIQDEATGEKWYLRVHTFSHAVTLECQSSLDNVSSYNIYSSNHCKNSIDSQCLLAGSCV